MAGVYHNGSWVEIDGATIIRTQRIEDKLTEDNAWEFERALEWVLANATSYGNEEPENYD